jgi:hypothetical protein
LAALLDVLAVRIRHIHSFASDGTFSRATSYFLSSSRILKTNELVNISKIKIKKCFSKKQLGFLKKRVPSSATFWIFPDIGQQSWT